MQTTASIALFHGAGQPFELCERKIVTPNRDEVLVRVSLATICGSDLHTFTGRRAAPVPCVLGHEAVGRIAYPTKVRDAYGEPLHEGDRVTWSLMAACGACRYCNERDLPQKCERLFKYGHAQSLLLIPSTVVSRSGSAFDREQQSTVFPTRSATLKQHRSIVPSPLF